MLFCLKSLLANRILIFRMIRMDLRKKFLGTYLGTIWAFINPIITTLIVFFVFRFGLKTMEINGVDFLPWLIVGLLAWFYVSDVLSTSYAAFTENPHLATKMKFPIEVLPPVKVASPLLIHTILIFLFILYVLFSGGVSSPSYFPQLGYYIFCSYAFLLGISYFTASAMVFVRDIGNIISAILQIFYWLTPIFWNPDLLPAQFQFLLKINPFYYIVRGYRDSIFNGIPVWERWQETLIFWAITVLLFIFGTFTFKGSRKHFANVL